MALTPPSPKAEHNILIHLALYLEGTVEGDPEHQEFLRVLARTAPMLLWMMRQTSGGTGELRIRFRDGVVVTPDSLGFTRTINSD